MATIAFDPKQLAIDSIAGEAALDGSPRLPRIFFPPAPCPCAPPCSFLSCNGRKA